MDSIQKILETIEEKNLSPIPKWQFLLKRYGLWAISVLLLICGSIGIASILFLLTRNDWDIYQVLDRGSLGHVFATLPYLWFVLFGIILLLLYLDLKHTKHGYRYSAFSIVLGMILVSSICGTVLHLAGISQKIDAAIMHHAPRQAHFFNPRIRFLSHPEEGIMMGEILDIEEEDEDHMRIQIVNPHLREKWTLLIDDESRVPEQTLSLKDQIRALGTILDEKGHTFYAEVILPLNRLEDHMVMPIGGMPPPPGSYWAKRMN